MGSSLGLYHLLKQLGHSVTVIAPTNWATFLNWMPDCRLVLDYESQTALSNTVIAEADWIFCLDFNTLNRTKRMEEKLSNATATRILIDHHLEPQADKFGIPRCLLFGARMGLDHSLIRTWNFSFWSNAPAG